MRGRAEEVDRHVGAKVRERRIVLGLTQQQLAELIGTTYQQAHKYEKGDNRISAGRLFMIAQALGVTVDYFFEELGSGEPIRPTAPQRQMLELVQNFTALSRRRQDALCQLARTLADAAPGPEDGGREAA
jgi:transcriptional regulator with XRE-family HTH domain